MLFPVSSFVFSSGYFTRLPPLTPFQIEQVTCLFPFFPPESISTSSIDIILLGVSPWNIRRNCRYVRHAVLSLSLNLSRELAPKHLAVACLICELSSHNLGSIFRLLGMQNPELHEAKSALF